MEQEIQDFYGVYLLCSKSELIKFRNRVYIGFTVNPNRRIKQHNQGIDAGGAKKTNNRGPWTMVMIIHGFPNNISALRFEWAWQQPKNSRRLKNISDIQRRRTKETYFQYNFRILTEMLQIGPWNRLPLVIRWLDNEYYTEFPIGKSPPLHMIIAHGRVKIKPKPKTQQETVLSQVSSSSLLYDQCKICHSLIDKDCHLICLNPLCEQPFHIICLANVFKDPGYYIPIQGKCPICRRTMLWGDLIRKKNGCRDYVDMADDETDGSDCDYDEIDVNDCNAGYLEDDLVILSSDSE